MNFLQADILFPVSTLPIRNGILVLNDNEIILDVIDPENYSGTLPLEIKKIDGFVTPGFVNTHCHLELSHLKGKFAEKTGLVEFIDQMRLNRQGENILEAIQQADEEMFENGIVAVADICNTDDTIKTKVSSQIYYHSFIELFDVIPGRAEKVFADGLELSNKFSISRLSNSPAPHAPYTVSAHLFGLLSKHYSMENSLSTIHNQETADEDSMFHSQSGGVFDFLFDLNPAVKEHINEFETSLSFVLTSLHNYKKLLLVHNTFSGIGDVESTARIGNKIYWCLCPNANLYIENTLPDIQLFRKSGCKITIGTDSYASNKSLSVLEELKTIAHKHEDISLHELLMWSCKNGAEFIDKSPIFGSFEKGKRPGIVNIQNVDIHMMKLKENSMAKRYKLSNHN